MIYIKARRQQIGLTQTELADQMGVIQNSVCAWEAGRKMPTADKLPKLARILRCSVDDLYREPAATAS